MIGTAAECKVNVKGYRLMTKAELEQYEDVMPEISMAYVWWLADVDPFDSSYIAYAEGNYSEEDMFCEGSEANTFVRAVLDIESNLGAGEKFIYKGYVFTALDSMLAVSDNFLGHAKYEDEDDNVPSIDMILGSLLGN